MTTAPEAEGSAAAGARRDPLGPGRDTASALVAALAARGQTIAVAESLTGGLLAAALVDVPGASAVLRGGVVAYATELKARLLGVDAALLAERGAVDAEVARQLAAGVRERLGPDSAPASIGVSTTGVAGPEPQDGKEVGTVFVGVATAAGAVAHRLALAGDRDEIRRAAVSEALRLALAAVTEEPAGDSPAREEPAQE